MIHYWTKKSQPHHDVGRKILMYKEACPVEYTSVCPDIASLNLITVTLTSLHEKILVSAVLDKIELYFVQRR